MFGINQPKAIVVNESNYTVFTGNISMNIMTNQLQGDTGNYAEGGVV
jgi:hypothetical protein